MLEQQGDHKARVSLRSVLHNQRLPLNVKTFCWAGEGGEMGVLVYLTFIVHLLPYFESSILFIFQTVIWYQK